MTAEHVDVLIIGAGLSGVAAACYLQMRCPAKRYVILEARDAIGGTWDLFRYPGVRSDSDMHTLGYAFRPWRDPKAIADGPAILRYIRETAADYSVDHHIRFNHRVRRAGWSTDAGMWTVEAERPTEGGQGTESVQYTCGFLYTCAGYYDYSHGYTPVFPGRERFTGRIIHPQDWPHDLDCTGKRIVVIGSGATAVTLVPALAQQGAAHVTMLQRSPTYIVARPSEDAIANRLRRHLPDRLAHQFVRWKNILFGMYFYNLTRRRPDVAKQMIIKMAREQLGPDYDVERHFTPRYNPWDQRLCLVPDADLFNAIKADAASVVTDEIETFTETGIRLRSGDELAADIIITATGLNMRLLSGMELIVDGAPVELGKTLSYRGMMYSDVPNLASSFGYTNASWTLKCELIAQYVCRLLNYMDQHGYTQCAPRRPATAIVEEPALPLTSGYVRRALDTLPRQGTVKPWKTYQNYALDLLNLRYSPLDDGVMEFTRGESRVPAPALQDRL